MKNLARKCAKTIRNAIKYTGPKVVFIHIPKCGGSSLKNALSRQLDPRRRYSFKYKHAQKAAALTSNKKLLATGITDDFEQLKFLLCYYLNNDHRFLYGHFPVDEEIIEHYRHEYHFVTLMRDPVERWKSNYLLNNGFPDPDSRMMPSRNFTGTLEDEFTALVDSGMGLLMGSLTTSFLAGRYPHDDADALALAETTTINLSRFSEVGTLNDLETCTANLSRLTGKNLSIRTDNKTQLLYTGKRSDEYLRGREFLNREDVTRKIAELGKADLLLYEPLMATRS